MAREPAGPRVLARGDSEEMMKNVLLESLHA